MKINSFAKLFFLVVISLSLTGVVAAQEAAANVKPTETIQGPFNEPPRPNLFDQLGLELSQIQQIRRLNAERRPLMEAAQRRFREVNRALDAAIYADQLDEAEVQERLKEVQLAQTDVAKVRFLSELAIRKILTAEQLVRFRKLRQRFEKVRQERDSEFRGNPQPMRNSDKPSHRFLRQNQ